MPCIRCQSLHYLSGSSFSFLARGTRTYNATQLRWLYGLSIQFLQGVVKCKHISSGFICHGQRVRDDGQDEFESQILAPIIRLVRCVKTTETCSVKRYGGVDPRPWPSYGMVSSSAELTYSSVTHLEQMRRGTLGQDTYISPAGKLCSDSSRRSDMS